MDPEFMYVYRSPYNFISQPLIGIFNLSEERAHHLPEPRDPWPFRSDPSELLSIASNNSIRAMLKFIFV